MTDSTAKTMETISLTLDNGSAFHFCGRLFSEASWYDEESDVLTHHKLYVTEEQDHVYSVVRGGGKNRTRAVYRIRLRGADCTVSDGHTEMVLPYDMLMLSIRSLCGLKEGETPTLEMVEETLRAANC